MSNEDLRQLLARVHERLKGTASLDDQARALLTETMRDIEKALARKEKSAGSVRTRLESMAVRFEAEHPAMAQTLRQLIDALGKAGI